MKLYFDLKFEYIKTKWSFKSLLNMYGDTMAKLNMQ